MQTWHALLVALGLSVVINTVLFLIAFRYRTDRLTDMSYALSFIALVVFAFWTSPAAVSGAKVALLGMVVVWALRLGIFLLVRIWKTRVDHRFDDMRNSFWKFGKFWEFQAVSVWIILLPTLLALSHSVLRFTIVSVVGIGIWLIGVATEATADLQKYHFSRQPANKDAWIDSGLWHYSRHPNYFGEMLTWIGVYVVAWSTLTPGQRLAGLVGPAFIVLLLCFVSGIPPLEKGADKRWGDNPRYRAYKRRTSVLIPWPARTSDVAVEK